MHVKLVFYKSASSVDAVAYTEGDHARTVQPGRGFRSVASTPVSRVTHGATGKTSAQQQGMSDRQRRRAVGSVDDGGGEVYRAHVRCVHHVDGERHQGTHRLLVCQG
ncbi:hypothetical protein ACWEO4_43940 [Streptomyces sp. NPDC004393]|uniref:hypothetical protein n=1 Tax=Streptomyces sp. NPDC004533 TaxID=3154278 RepID=UPI0033A7784F